MIRPIALAPIALAMTLMALPAIAQTTLPPVLALEWTLAEVDGVAAAYDATLSVAADGRLAGRAPCNRYFSTLQGNLPNVTLAAIGATKMACEAMADEAAYFTLLRGVDRLTLSDREVHLSGAGHSLIFRRPLD